MTTENQNFTKMVTLTNANQAVDDFVQPWFEGMGISYQQIETWIRTTFEKDNLDDKILKFLGWSDYALAETDK